MSQGDLSDPRRELSLTTLPYLKVPPFDTTGGFFQPHTVIYQIIPAKIPTLLISTYKISASA